MTLNLPEHLRTALQAWADIRLTTPEEVAVSILTRFVAPPPPPPTNDWERKLLSIATECGGTLPREALSSEGLYE